MPPSSAAAYDVVVVGAGPAGAWAAYCLARRGARVAIFDPSHPREKACGGGITARALTLVAGALDASTLSRSVIRQARFTSPDSPASAVVPLTRRSPEGRTESSRSSRPPSPRHELPGLIVTSREGFDGALLEAARSAGAELVQTRVSDLASGPDGIRLDTRDGPHRARFVIGADGANSLVRRRLLRPFRRDELSVASGYYARGVTSDEIVIELVADPPGYIWSFPRPDHLAVGICAGADS
jgi:flavin-dependent dehydrogenase